MADEVILEYDKGFFDGHSLKSRRSAAVVIPIVNELVRPKSVLDVGCGNGLWLAEWIDQGVTDVCGLDGAYVDSAMIQIEPANFRAVDLENSFSLARRFDLVQSLEVAEHLDESCADTFVQSLVNHADTVLFSAAIPGQRGTHHVNEQWPSYWAEKFSHHGLRLFDPIRPVIWKDPRVSWWYRQNTVLFSRNFVFEMNNSYTDVVHPECFEASQGSQPSLRRLIAHFPAAAKSAARNRLPIGRARRH
jgi:SAM-dependent methyltransferase